MKKIIGYKAPTDLFKGTVPKDTIYIKNSPNGSTSINQYGPEILMKDGSSGTILPAEIVETWEPVYESCKPGDYIRTFSEPVTGGAGFVPDTTLEISYIETYEDDTILFFVDHSNGIYDDSVRPATAEEIQEYKDKAKIVISEYPLEINSSRSRISFGCQSFTLDEVKFIKRLLGEGCYTLEAKGTKVTYEMVDKIIKRVENE